MRTIKSFILAMSLFVSLLFFGGAYLVVSGIFNQSVQQSALKDSDLLARSTFASMYQLMSTGWTREQLEQFVEANREALAGSGYELDIFRGPVVAEQYGETKPDDFDGLLYDQLHSEESAYKFYDDLIEGIENSDAEFGVSRERLLETLEAIREEEAEGVERVTRLMEQE